MKDLGNDLDFILEVDKMKSIFRRSINLSNDRRENDAEHKFLCGYFFHDFRRLCR